MATNPYRPVFGEEPIRKISREQDVHDIVDGFASTPPNRRSTFVVGVRGSGKTAFMSEVVEELKQKSNWIIVRLNPERNLLEDFLHKLISHRNVIDSTKLSKINLSFLGIEIGEEKDLGHPITNIEVAIQELLELVKRKNKRVLVCIDEVSNTPQAKEFFGSFQIFIGEKLPLFFIGTVLYENLSSLKNEPNMTFLYRMPRIEMESLDMSAIIPYADNV